MKGYSMDKTDPDKEKQIFEETDIATFLRKINLDFLINVFEQENITIEILKEMTHDDLKEIGIKSFGYRHVILEAAKKIKGNTHAIGGKVSSPVKAIHSVVNLLQRKVFKRSNTSRHAEEAISRVYDVKPPTRDTEEKQEDSGNEQQVVPLVEIYPKGEISIKIGGTIQLRIRLNIKENFTVLWKYNLENTDTAVILQTEDLKYIGSQPTVLQINNIDESDEGTYHALVSNSAGAGESSRVFIKIIEELDPNTISEDENNFLRLYMLCQRYGTEAVRILFDNTIPPSTLEVHLENHERDIMKKCKFTRSQIDTIFPINPPPVTSDKLDISIMYSLLRNTTNLAPPRYNWTQNIEPNEILPVHDLERIKSFRNELAHSGGSNTLKLTKTEFNIKWQKLEMAIGRLSHGALTNEVKSLLTMKFDRSSQHGVLKALKEMDRRILTLERECHIPIHIKEQHTQILQEWEIDGKSFQETRAYRKAKEIIEERELLIIVGGPGSGKTCIARHLALHLKAQKWETIPVRSCEEIQQFLNPVINQIFVLDNPFGNFGLDMSKYECCMGLFGYLPCLSEISTKVILTCRKNVFVECKDLDMFAFEDESTIDIDGEDFHLNSEEKTRILESYCIKRNIPKVIYDKISVEENYPLFPLLCNLLKKEDDILHNFHHPYECLKRELVKMRMNNTIKFVVLVLCVFRNNVCVDEFLHKNRQLLSELLSNCGLSHKTSISVVRDALFKLEGTYLSDIKNRVMFIHDSVFEVVAHMYGKENIQHFLKHISYEYLTNNIEFVMSRESSSNSLVLHLQTEDCFYLAARIFHELKQLNHFPVFGSKKSLLKVNPFLQSFHRYLDGIHFVGIKNLFLVDHSYISKWYDFEDVYTFQGLKSFRQRILMSHSTDRNMPKVRALSWVFAFGHTEILRYLIKRSENYVGGKLIGTEVRDLFLTNDLQEQTRLLMLSCLSGELEIVNFVIQHCDSRCLKTEYPPGLYVPILVSCLTPYSHVVEALIHAGADVNETENAYYNVRDTAILTAVKNNHTSVVEVLIKHGADVNKRNANMETPLIVASKNGSLELVKLLLINDAEVELGDREDKTALFYGIKNSHTQIAKCLLEKGSDLSLFIDNKQSLSVFELQSIQDCLSIIHNIDEIMYRAAEFGRIDILEYIRQWKQEAKFPDSKRDCLLYLTCKNGQFDAMKYLLENGHDVNYYDEQHTTPLCAASEVGDISIVSYLVENTTSNPNQTDIHHKSPLHWATENNNQKIVEYLVRNGASINILDENNTSALHISCSKGNYEMVSFLLTHGADLNVVMKGGKTPLFCAIEKRRLKIRELLIEHGANFHTHNSQKVSLLHLASGLGDIETVQRLIDLGCQVNICDNFGYFPLTIAIDKGYFEIIKCLVVRGKADINLCDEMNKSPLLKASEKGNKEIAEFLLSNGAYVDLADVFHQTPLHMAVRNSHNSVIQVLLHYGADVNAIDKFGKLAFDYSSDEISNEFLHVFNTDQLDYMETLV